MLYSSQYISAAKLSSPARCSILINMGGCDSLRNSILKQNSQTKGNQGLFPETEMKNRP